MFLASSILSVPESDSISTIDSSVGERVGLVLNDLFGGFRG